jgi:hypothetical protein
MSLGSETQSGVRTCSSRVEDRACDMISNTIRFSKDHFHHKSLANTYNESTNV